MTKERVYLVCDVCDPKARSIDGTPNIGVEYMGHCSGRVLHEDGAVIGQHASSSIGWLRSDLLGKLDDPEKYEIVDLLNEAVPERFALI